MGRQSNKLDLRWSTKFARIRVQSKSIEVKESTFDIKVTINSSQLWKPDPHFARQHWHASVKSLAFNLTDERFVAYNMEDEEIKLKFTCTLKVEVICDMDFTDFPFDDHNCKFKLESLKNQRDLR